MMKPSNYAVERTGALCARSGRSPLRSAHQRRHRKPQRAAQLRLSRHPIQRTRVSRPASNAAARRLVVRHFWLIEKLRWR